MFTIYEGLDPKSDADRFYIPKKNRARSLIAIEDCVELAVRDFDVNIYGNEGRLSPCCQEREVRWLRSSKCFEDSDEREEIARVG